jgi:RNA polymerase sigma-70 factor (ECF subfamily)
MSVPLRGLPAAAAGGRIGLVRLDEKARRSQDFEVVAAIGPPRENKPGAGPKTLGDVLSKASAVPVPESYWVGLVEAIAGGDQPALYALYARTHRLVFTLVVRITGNRETAEEVTLDVFHDVWRRASTYAPGGGSVIGWIMNQARSRAIDRLRYEQRKKRVDHGPADVLPVPAAGGPQEAIIAREQSRLLNEALHVLTLEERQAIETAFFEELTYSEAATRLKQPLGTVKTRIRSGLGKLRDALAGTKKNL